MIDVRLSYRVVVPVVGAASAALGLAVWAGASEAESRPPGAAVVDFPSPRPSPEDQPECLTPISCRQRHGG